VFFGSIAAGAFGGGLYMNAQSADAADVYQASQSYDSAVHGRNWEEYESTARARNILYGVAGVFAVGFTLSIPF
jgi:hypothetical protein